MRTWCDKANRIIAELSWDAWHKANHNKQGKRYKKHRPYSVPEDAQMLVECLGDHDQKCGEERAKRYFVWGY